jgi:hypothetical protein
LRSGRCRQIDRAGAGLNAAPRTVDPYPTLAPRPATAARPLPLHANAVQVMPERDRASEAG